MKTARNALRCRFLAACTLVFLCVTLSGGYCATLLSSTLPGAFGVRYLPDRAVVSYTVTDPREPARAERFRLTLWLPQPARWAFLDGELLDAADLGQAADDHKVTLPLPLGTHRLHVGWAGKPSLPPERAEVPVMVSGRRAGALTARFTLNGMQASGEIEAGPGIVSVAVLPAGEIDPAALSLSIGRHTIASWSRRGDRLVSPERVMIKENPLLTLSVESYGLVASPVARLFLEDFIAPTPVQRVAGDKLPTGALLIEAEQYVEAGGTPVQVDPGSHYDTSGGACVFTFIGDGSWLEWEVTVPADGAYDLLARISCGDTGAFRQILLDGRVIEGLELVAFPGTGGWGHAEGEWWLVRLTGGEGLASPLQLSAGTHRLRIVGVLEKHLNFDYIALVPHSSR